MGEHFSAPIENETNLGGHRRNSLPLCRRTSLNEGVIQGDQTRSTPVGRLLQLLGVPKLLCVARWHAALFSFLKLLVIKELRRQGSVPPGTLLRGTDLALGEGGHSTLWMAPPSPGLLLDDPGTYLHR